MTARRTMPRLRNYLNSILPKTPVTEWQEMTYNEIITILVVNVYSFLRLRGPCPLKLTLFSQLEGKALEALILNKICLIFVYFNS